MDALSPPTALALHGALPISLKSLRSHISPDLEGFQDLYGRHLPPRLLDPLHELSLVLTVASVHFVDILFDAFPDGQIKDIEHRRIPWLLDELNVEVFVHHSGELVECATAARDTVAASRVDLQLHAPVLVPETSVFGTDFAANFSKYFSEVFPVHRGRLEDLGAGWAVAGVLLCDEIRL